MLKNLIDKFNTFQSQFSYRKRFLFFAVTFFICIPAPSYWLLKTQKFFLNRADLEYLGNRYQSIFQNILFYTLRHQLLTSASYLNKKNNKSEIDSIVKQIYNSLAELTNLQEGTNPPQIFFGKGFSDPKPQALNFTALKQHWKEISQASSKTTYSQNLDLHNKLVTEIQVLFKQLRYTYGFYLSPQIEIHLFSDVSLDKIPDAQSLVMSIYSLGLKMRSEQPTEDDLVNIVHYINLLEANVKAVKILLERAFKHYEEGFNYNGYLLRDSKDALYEFYDNIYQYLFFISNTPTERVSNDSLVNSLISLATKSLKSSNLLHESIQKIIQDNLEYRIEKYNFSYTFTILLLLISSFLITFYVVFRVLSYHLNHVHDNIKLLASGQTPDELYSNSEDEFSDIERVFRKMTNGLNLFISRLKESIQQVLDSSKAINKSSSMQKGILEEQEATIKRIEFIAKQIGTNSRYLSDMMTQLGVGPQQSTHANIAQQLLDGMRETTKDLTEDSKKIILQLDVVQEKVDQAKPLISFMTRVNDKARLLYLNASIEASEADENTKAFKDTTQQIKRFATNSAKATNDIRTIILNMSESVTKMRKDISLYLKKFTKGLERLTTVNQQLSGITKKIEEQTNQFAVVDMMMQEQASEAENIIQFVSNIRTSAEENSISIQNLQELISEIGISTYELLEVLSRFQEMGFKYVPETIESTNKSKK